ncbi:peptidoglycan synthetase [Pedobacter sp. HMF7647]|uniref:Peptidoglycan synthetase n=1 Tax=Hufsiella arboris TaxID=2695275 RepID=A0A7K1Y6M4_9SPHI|nr:Mur ligase family protein [Hufsiella arboris]MXV50224.1 peptidoglycan synthetase [Hufsiella arboris]
MNLHFIAIGGSAMHNLAIALKKKGFVITGSDDAIYEPSASRLSNYGLLPKEMGWFENNITSEIDAVILGMHARPDNPELLKAQELGIKIYSYPEYVYEQSKHKKRVVIGGSHGKTTITSMIIHVLKNCNKEFDYLVGAQLEGFDTMIQLTDAPVIVIEGDEYLSSPIDRRPKFHLYHADVGVISGIAWDHVNVFPTFDNYKEQFDIFIDTIAENGALIFCKDDEVLSELVKSNKSGVQKIPYSVPAHEIKDGVTKLTWNNEQVPLTVFGQHNLLNLNAAWNVCKLLGIGDIDFITAIKTFKGASKRLEVIGKNDDSIIFKDFAHSPSKLKATVNAVKQQFPNRNLIAIIELHTFSSLNKSFISEYYGSLDLADEAIVFIDQSTFRHKNLEPYDENVVRKSFGNNKLKYFNDAKILEEFLSYINLKGKNLLLMSSGNFGGINLNILADNLLKHTHT